GGVRVVLGKRPLPAGRVELRGDGDDAGVGGGLGDGPEHPPVDDEFLGGVERGSEVGVGVAGPACVPAPDPVHEGVGGEFAAPVGGGLLESHLLALDLERGRRVHGPGLVGQLVVLGGFADQVELAGDDEADPGEAHDAGPAVGAGADAGEFFVGGFGEAGGEGRVALLGAGEDLDGGFVGVDDVAGERPDAGHGVAHEPGPELHGGEGVVVGPALFLPLLGFAGELAAFAGGEVDAACGGGDAARSGW